jgi:hypothetical protein
MSTVKRKLKIGNDGYGSKNITVTKNKQYITITKTDPHGWGRVSDEIFIPVNDIEALIEFLTTKTK